MIRLTKNFTKEEFDAKDNACMPNSVIINVLELARNLQVLRDYLNKPVIINSGYRSKEHNAAVGGAPKSQHLTGKGADIKVNGMSARKLFETIEKLIAEGKMEDGGLGYYPAHVHYDIRGKHARW